MKAPLALLATLWLCGCATADSHWGDGSFGNAVRQNAAAQTISPEGVEEDASTSIDGVAAEQVIDRYRRPPRDAADERLIEDLGN